MVEPPRNQGRYQDISRGGQSYEFFRALREMANTAAFSCASKDSYTCEDKER